MMNDKLDKLIQGFIDGELSKQEERELKEHLKVCKECRIKLKAKEKLTSLIKSTQEEVKPPEGLIDEIISQTLGRRIYRFNFKYAIIGAAALIIISLFLFVFFIDFHPPIAKQKEGEEIPVAETYKIGEKQTVKPKPKESEKIKVHEQEKEVELARDLEKPSMPSFKETRLVFPEQGSVVGDEFEVVIILKEPADKIELSIDGQKKIYESRDSNILFIGSDSLPVLEKGMHYLALKSPGQHSITFFKEG